MVLDLKMWCQRGRKLWVEIDSELWGSSSKQISQNS